MNVAFFKENLELMSYSGFRLTDVEAGLVEYSLILLQNANKFQEIFFLGRIQTTSSIRYYLSFGYTNDMFKDQKLFYSLNGYDWVMMPEIKPKLIPVALQSRELFTGDPMYIEHVCLMPTFVPDTENVFRSCPRKPKKLKEEDKLACIVHLLLTEAAIIPRGLLYRQVTRCISLNPCFTGLNRVEANEMKNFQLFRYPQNNRNYNLTKHDDFNYQTDFFDAIDDVKPRNCFHSSINDRDICQIRALNWPGMTFVHKINTKYQGFFYFGNGKRNLDLLFMT